MKCSCWMIHYNLSRSHRVKLATASPGSTIQTGLSSITVGSLCVCVITHAWPPDYPTPLHFDHSLFSICACVTPSRLRLITLLYKLTDRWVFFWLIHSLKLAQNHKLGYTHRQKDTHTHLSDLTESLSLYLKFNGPWVQQFTDTKVT